MAEKVKIRVSKSQIILFAVIFGIIAAGILGYVYYYDNFKPVTTAEFNGQSIEFRANLREAQKVEVIPDETELRNQIVKPPRIDGPNGQIIIRKPLSNVTIVFKSLNESARMGWYTVEVSEIVKKLTALYKGKYDVNVNFAISEVDDYENLRGSNTAPIIALVHPDIAEETFVSVDDNTNVITISGGDSLKDFDLATVKFLMVALDIKI
jgi:hypothetical protein